MLLASRKAPCLMLHSNRKDYSLNTLCAATDDRLIRTTSRSLEDYRHWLASRVQ